MDGIRKAGGIRPPSRAETVEDDATAAESIPDDAFEGARPVGKTPPKAVLDASPLLNAVGRLAIGAAHTRSIDDASAVALAELLMNVAANQGFEVRLTHILLERVCTRSVLSTRARQRLVSAINAAFGKTGERFSASRPAHVDVLGLPRGDNGFADLLLVALKERA